VGRTVVLDDPPARLSLSSPPSKSRNRYLSVSARKKDSMESAIWRVATFSTMAYPHRARVMRSDATMQGLALVPFSAQPEPCLTKKHPLTTP